MRLDERLHNPGPGSRHITAVVSAATGADDPSIAIFVRKTAQFSCRGRVRFLSPVEVRDRIARKTVRTALH